MSREPVKKSRFHLIMTSAIIGSLMEWYDFAAYVFMAAPISRLFFPHDNSYIALMLTYVVFAVGYFMRPIGGILFGHFGDRIGRQKTLTYTILLMSVPTVLIGLLPTYHQIGILAPILLILLRMVQGLSTGGEMIGSISFVFESSPAKHRGLTTAAVWGASGFGFLLGSAAVAFLTTHMTQSQLLHWGWRIPFFFGILTGVVGYFIRQKTEETVYFVAMKKRGEAAVVPIIQTFKQHKKTFLKIFFIFMPAAVMFYTVFIFLPTYAFKFIKHPMHSALTINSIALSVLLIFEPVFGFLSDRYGRKPFMIVAMLICMVISIPLFSMMTSGVLMKFLIAQCIFAFLDAMYTGSVMAAVLESVPTRLRYSTVAGAYNLSYSIFGGTAPLVVTFLIHSSGRFITAAYYIVLVSILALPIAIKMRETFKNVIV